MALDPVPWFIGGGAEHGPEVARMLAYAATSGAEGVISPTDLRVAALPTPGAAVRVYPGGAVMLNRYPGAPNQSYTVRSPSATDVPVTATGSGGGAIKYVILRVDDPQYGGQAPANLVSGPYVRYDVVTSITGLNFPFIPVARINQPANTATITGPMIQDFRTVANPRSYRRMLLEPVSTVKDLTSSTMVKWPGPDGSIQVPSWATYANIIVQVVAAAQNAGAVYGEMQLRFAGLLGQVSPYDINSGASAGDGARAYPLVMKWESPVTSVAGTTQAIEVLGRRISGPGYLRADLSTQVLIDVEFTEVPV